MPLFTKLNPAGIDVPIKRLQTELFVALCDRWQLNVETGYDCFGRVHRNEYDGMYVPEAYNSASNDYREVLVDDRRSVTSFLVEGERMPWVSGTAKAAVGIVFFVNLREIGKDQLIRPDWDARLDVMELLQGGPFGFEPTEVANGVTAALSDFPGTRAKLSVRKMDLHPWHCFRINTTLVFNPLQQ